MEVPGSDRYSRKSLWEHSGGLSLHKAISITGLTRLARSKLAVGMCSMLEQARVSMQEGFLDCLWEDHFHIFCNIVVDLGWTIRHSSVDITGLLTQHKCNLRSRYMSLSYQLMQRVRELPGSERRQVWFKMSARCLCPAESFTARAPMYWWLIEGEDRLDCLVWELNSWIPTLSL